ncbi:hypothetical protein OBK20_04935 [Empedobacter falsenii]|uniref:Uncharacterized protein n=1 Tax=Empedobacter falsenii TaxID=343874 RepID=A0ABY8V9B3_9FLAO|nr:hypothetical protein [Empedobacter falsenii]WIH97496.1 hypothetical protein OBA43_00775 [Empedobacter falsenii]
MKKIMVLMVCSLLASFGNAQEYTTNNIIIKQGNQTFNIDKAEQTITLRPEEFSVEYLNKPYQEKKNLFYAAQALVTDHTIDINLHEGTEIESIPYFEAGTGFAAKENQLLHYPFLSLDGHQYLYYVPNKDKRVEKSGTSGQWDIHKWTLKGVFQYDAEMDWNIYDNNQVYITLIIDRNLDGILQKGEFFTLQIMFEK